MQIAKSEKLVLIVEDSEDTLDSYSHFLRGRGYRVASAMDGQKGLDEAARLHPDVILMDLSLPGVGGRAATQRLKRNSETRKIPVIIVTANSTEGIETVTKEGCDGFLIKPCMPEDLLKEVVRVLERRAV